jgi:hypothetical protein
MVKAELGIHLFKSTVLFFKLFEPFYIRDTHICVFGFPAVVGGVRYAVFTTYIYDFYARLGFFEDGDYLSLTRSSFSSFFKLRVFYKSLSAYI